jgi:hypothetical protein
MVPQLVRRTKTAYQRSGTQMLVEPPAEKSVLTKRRTASTCGPSRMISRRRSRTSGTSSGERTSITVMLNAPGRAFRPLAARAAVPKANGPASAGWTTT